MVDLVGWCGCSRHLFRKRGTDTLSNTEGSQSSNASILWRTCFTLLQSTGGARAETCRFEERRSCLDKMSSFFASIGTIGKPSS